MTEHSKILKTEQVAEILGLKPGTVRQAARVGRLPAYRLPDTRTYFYFEGEVLEWLRSRSDGPSSSPDG